MKMGKGKDVPCKEKEQDKESKSGKSVKQNPLQRKSGISVQEIIVIFNQDVWHEDKEFLVGGSKGNYILSLN